MLREEATKVPDRPLIRILMVDDHPVFRLGLRNLLGAQSDMVVVGEAASAGEAMELVRRLTPDVVLVDVALDGSDGIDLVRWMRRAHPDVAALVLSMHSEEVLAPSAIAAGALGYVSKDSDHERLLEAVRSVHADEVHLSSDVARRLLRQASGRPLNPGGIQALSGRELQVFRLLGEGRGPTEIASILHVSVKTVEAHQSRIRRKLGVTSAHQVRQRAALWVASGREN